MRWFSVLYERIVAVTRKRIRLFVRRTGLLTALTHSRQIFLSPGMDTRMRKRVKKKFVFGFVHSTITIHARPHIVYNSPYTVHHILHLQQHESFSIPILELHIKRAKICLHVKRRRSFHFNFFSPFCRQSSIINIEWMIRWCDHSDDCLLLSFFSVFVLILNSLILRTTSVTRTLSMLNAHIFMVSLLHSIF